MGTKYSKTSDKIYIPWGTGLGDVWSSINIYLNFSVQRSETVRMATWYAKRKHIRNVKGKAEEILPLIDSEGEVELTQDAGNDRYFWKDGGSVKFFPTKVKWKPNKSKTICYQFDGKTHKCKNFASKQEEDKVLNHIKGCGYKAVQIGAHLSLKECVQIQSECEIFVGVTSGFAVMGASTGIPLFVILNQMDPSGVTFFYDTKSHLFIKDANSFIETFNKYLTIDDYYNKANKGLL